MSNIRIESFHMPELHNALDENDLEGEPTRVLNLIGQVSFLDSNEHDNLPFDCLVEILQELHDFECTVIRDPSDAILGVMSTKPDIEQGELYIDTIAVDESSRRKGFGKTLIEHAVSEAKQKGLKRLGSQSVQSAIPAHYGWGFTMDEGEQHKLMPRMYRNI